MGTEKPSVFVPPDIRYWAFGKVSTTIYDEGGLPWFCYTYRQTHCRPLFKLPPGFRTTRRPFRSDNPARSSTPQPITTTRPPVTILRTNTAGDFTTSSIRINNRGRKIDAGPKFNSFTTEMPNYGQQQ